MTAVELMDPKLDTGYGVVRDLTDIQLPSTLSPLQVINIMDQLLACEMSWLDAHTLPQTVFSCVYAQRMPEIPRSDLFSYIRIQLATVDMIMKVIMDEKVAEDESFFSWTYGFRLRPLSNGPFADDEKVLDDTLKQLRRSLDPSQRDERYNKAITLRVTCRVHLYRVLKLLTTNFASTTEEDAINQLLILEQLVTEWQQSSAEFAVDKQLIDTIFDQSINRHLMTALPPRPSPVLVLTSAFKYLLRLVIELKALVCLRRVSLPLNQASHSLPSTEEDCRCSLQVAFHAVEAFCSQYNPRVLTRSVMSRIMVREHSSALFEQDSADLIGMMATDVGLRDVTPIAREIEDAAALRDGITSLFKWLCLNRSRQRRQTLHVLKWWDHYVALATQVQKKNHPGAVEGTSHRHSEPNGDDEDKGASASADVVPDAPATPTPAERETLDFISSKTPLNIVAFEVAARQLVQHFLLGFEVDLYQSYEYPAVFFYIAYILTSMINGTIHLMRSSPNNSYFHPVRFSLYLLDEARLWLCRALYSTLEALSTGKQWDYTSHRCPTKPDIPMFGSEELWYEQRFGVVNGLRNTPPYADYASFLSFQSYQKHNLRLDDITQDAVLVQLQEGANGFLTARKKAERAKKIVARSSSNVVVDEILKIAGVAIENSLVVSSLIRSHLESRPHDNKKPQSIRFNFHRHRHFPVLQVVQ